MTLLQGVVVVLSLVGCSLPAHTQVAFVPPTATANSRFISLTPTQIAVFQDSLNSISDQAHITIVTEGTPLKPRLNTLAASKLRSEVAASSAIAALATAYDYNVQRVSGVFVLTKRYSLPQDLPCVTLAECSQAGQHIAGLLDAFNPHFAQSSYMDGPDGEKDAIVRFFASLSPLQLAAAQSKMLRYGDLLPDQKNIVTSLCLFPIIQMPSNRVTETSGYLDSAGKGAITLRDEQNYPGLFLIIPGSTSKSVQYVSLSSGVAFSEQPGVSSLSSPAFGGPQPTAPATLGSVMATLGTIGGQKPLAASSISGKPVMAFGLKYAKPKDVMSALAALYGLRNGAAPSGSPQLEPPYIPAPLELKQLNAALWATVPASFDRTLHLQVADSEIIYSEPGLEATPPNGLPADKVKEYAVFQSSQAEMKSRMIPNRIKQEAASRLLAAILPQVKKLGPKAHISVAALDDGARNALAALLMADITTDLQNSFGSQSKQSVMNCFDNMDQTIIWTEPGAAAHVYGQIVPSFNLIGTDPYTNKQIALGGVQYTSHEYSDLDPKPAK